MGGWSTCIQKQCFPNLEDTLLHQAKNNNNNNNYNNNNNSNNNNNNNNNNKLHPLVALTVPVESGVSSASAAALAAACFAIFCSRASLATIRGMSSPSLIGQTKTTIERGVRGVNNNKSYSSSVDKSKHLGGGS
jgi:hypothetical protein